MTELLSVESFAEPDFQTAAGLVLASSIDEFPVGAAGRWVQIADGARRLGGHHAAKIAGSAVFGFELDELDHALTAKIIILAGTEAAPSLSQVDRSIKGNWIAPEPVKIPASVSMMVETSDLLFRGGTRPLAMLTAACVTGTKPEIHGLNFSKSEDGSLVGEAVTDDRQIHTMARMLVALTMQPERAKPVTPNVPEIRNRR